ncbi:hypothetical protein K461DRAFT_175540 [Myriangium duriaei CBS 260.36]|uniref:Uncharacterized protein n=1 Tax=Myriangium duriaei CBS 260.36 TaxID=1168546 RepID=A0A9P4IXN7_9PEZI|nr:hypothetical protein K461DRAFT_175540 [Myriangium duriaei CBS 260.36]
MSEHLTTLQRSRLLDLPTEIKILIYDHVWAASHNEDRWISFPGYLTEHKLVDNNTGICENRACEDLWALTRTCKEVYAQVLPLLYRGVYMDVNLSPYKFRGHALNLFTRFRIDLVMDLRIDVYFYEGFARAFAVLVDLISQAKCLDNLVIEFTFWDEYEHMSWPSLSAETELACSSLQKLQLNADVYFMCDRKEYHSIRDSFRKAEKKRQDAIMRTSPSAHQRPSSL